MHLMGVLCCLYAASQGQTAFEEQFEVVRRNVVDGSAQSDCIISSADCIRAQQKSDVAANFTADKSSVRHRPVNNPLRSFTVKLIKMNRTKELKKEFKANHEFGATFSSGSG